MKQNSQFFSFFFILLLVSGTPSCKKNPPEIRREKTEKLQEICLALQSRQNKKALALIRTSPEFRNTSLANHLHNRERDRKLIQQLNQALLAQRYSRALNVIQEAEQNGEASADLLKLKELPYALQALQLFCVRMPWENAEDLQKNWKLLAQHESVLKEAPAFRIFRQEQKNLLLSFRQEEQRAQSDFMLARIDSLSAGGKLQAARILAAGMKRRFPAHKFSQMICWKKQRSTIFRNILNGKTPLLQDNAVAFDLTMALAWPDLSPDEQKKGGEILAETGRRTTISGTMLRAVHLNTDAALLDALVTWQKAAEPEQTLPEPFQKALRNRFTVKKNLSGISSVLEFLNQYRSLNI